MGKFAASYLVRVTLRERDGAKAPKPPTNRALAAAIRTALGLGSPSEISRDFEATVRSERTDK